jgi:hypothetical protein
MQTLIYCTFQVHSSHKKIKYVNIELCREVSNFLGDPRITVVSSAKVKLNSVFKTLKSWKGNFAIPDDLRPEAFQIKGFFSVTYQLKVSDHRWNDERIVAFCAVVVYPPKKNSRAGI